VDFVVDCLGRAGGGEVFVPKAPSMRVVDLADAIAPGAARRVIGIRPGEKLHEVLLTEEESRHAVEYDGGYVITPQYASWAIRTRIDGSALPEGFRYTSDANERWLSVDELREISLAASGTG
jgi:UDP-N-acetylglucosamine 4,6-dehydratase